VFDIEGITYVVDKGLDEQAKDIKVDYVTQWGRSGFMVTSSVALGGGSSCGTSCSC
jgi:Fe-S cluster assembly iron-binding protein IscA